LGVGPKANLKKQTTEEKGDQPLAADTKRRS